MEKLNTQDFSKSDAVMGCCISTAIGLLWTEDQLKEKAAKLTATIKKVMAKNTSTAPFMELNTAD
jgi:8-amino-3,8-dideoxy-alpha-D-manno-octulosonate transaminase